MEEDFDWPPRDNDQYIIWHADAAEYQAVYKDLYLLRAAAGRLPSMTGMPV